MNIKNLKEQATKEIINCLYHLDSEIFPNFSLDSCELNYGIQETFVKFFMKFDFV